MSPAHDVLSERLDAFLAAHGATRQTLVSEVTDAFGAPLLVAATGSIIQGFGNRQSDLDINVVVDHAVTRLPVPSHRHGFLLHATYFAASEIESWIDDRGDGRPTPAKPMTRDEWLQRETKLTYCTRFRDGVVLSARASWDCRIAEFRQPWLISEVAEWWRLESIRRCLGGRWLADVKPMLAAQRRFEAVLATLERRAAIRGQLYFGPKWLSEKLRALDDAEGLGVLHAFMKAPLNEREARDYSERCEAWLTKFSDCPGDGIYVQLWYLPGVKVRELDGRVVVSRWNLRAIELGPATPRVTDSHPPIWEGNLDMAPPPDVLRLFLAHMTWLSVGSCPQ